MQDFGRLKEAAGRFFIRLLSGCASIERLGLRQFAAHCKANAWAAVAHERPRRGALSKPSAQS